MNAYWWLISVSIEMDSLAKKGVELAFWKLCLLLETKRILFIESNWPWNHNASIVELYIFNQLK